MATLNVGKSGTFLVDMSSADDVWRKLADPSPQAPATLQRVSKRASKPPMFNAEPTSTFSGQEKIRAVQNKSSGFVQSGWEKMRPPSVEEPADPWSHSERRLWFVAGTLMAGAVAVLTVFAVITFGGVHLTNPPASAASTPSSPIPGVPELTILPAPAAPVATPVHDANTFRPPLPARVRSETIHATTVARKHVKHHKSGKRIARND
jgi:hypothetical protein